MCLIGKPSVPTKIPQHYVRHWGALSTHKNPSALCASLGSPQYPQNPLGTVCVIGEPSEPTRFIYQSSGLPSAGGHPSGSLTSKIEPDLAIFPQRGQPSDQQDIPLQLVALKGLIKKRRKSKATVRTRNILFSFFFLSKERQRKTFWNKKKTSEAQ